MLREKCLFNKYIIFFFLLFLMPFVSKGYCEEITKLSYYKGQMNHLDFFYNKKYKRELLFTIKSVGETTIITSNKDINIKFENKASNKKIIKLPDNFKFNVYFNKNNIYHGNISLDVCKNNKNELIINYIIDNDNKKIYKKEKININKDGTINMSLKNSFFSGVIEMHYTLTPIKEVIERKDIDSYILVGRTEVPSTEIDETKYLIIEGKKIILSHKLY